MIPDFTPIILTLKLALVTTIILLIIGMPLAYWLAYAKTRFKYIFEAVINTPLVLPPSVLGFYFLLFFSPENTIGKFLKNTFNLKMVFTFEGLVLGSVIFSLPFMVQSIQAGFQGLPSSLKEASYTLGKSKLQTAIRVLIPNIKPAILTGIVLTFAHTIGEFGLVLMIGGSIPGVTKVASIAIYEEVESLNYSTAHFFAFTLLFISFSLLLLIYYLNNRIFKPVIK